MYFTPEQAQLLVARLTRSLRGVARLHCSAIETESVRVSHGIFASVPCLYGDVLELVRQQGSERCEFW